MSELATDIFEALRTVALGLAALLAIVALGTLAGLGVIWPFGRATPKNFITETTDVDGDVPFVAANEDRP